MINDNTIWDNSNIYKGLEDNQIESDFSFIETEIERLSRLTTDVKNNIKDILSSRYDATIKLYSLRTFFYCYLSQNSQNEIAMKKMSKVSSLSSKLKQALNPAFNYCKVCEESVLNEILDDEKLSSMRAYFEYEREFKDFILSNEEESMITTFSNDGLHAWGNLYNKISGSIKCEIDGKKLGISTASSMLRSRDESERRKSWEAIDKGWREQEIASSSILNAINGWRLEELKKRSSIKNLHFLDVATFQSKVTRTTLDSLISTTFERKNIGQRAMNLMAKVLGKNQLDVWDIGASAPSRGENKLYSFKDGIDICIQAFSSFNPEMGEFARMMYEKNWIDSGESENRSAGAYCTGFSSVREPRVFMTYTGTMGNVLTLAHEIGHAYHNWVMRDMPFDELNYPMTLAESASIFAETLVRDYLITNSDSESDKFEIAWQEAMSASVMICNIPTRFEFEKLMVEERMKGELSPSDLRKIMKSSWEKWYGDATRTQDEMFWATKLHFSISGIGFYNYPYLFGYLFSLGLYAQKEVIGSTFKDKYIEILRDTGRMDAVSLIKKHLGQNIEEAGFWNSSLDIVEKSIDQFEKLI